MEPGLDKELWDIMSDLECPKDFKCYKWEFTASEIESEAFQLCSEERSQECPFKFPMAGVAYCKCPVRVYLAQKLREQPKRHTSSFHRLSHSA
jgi:hypothetical protein